jgi:two-component system phosphate regulon sensor histidine kinase PhoR
VIQSQAKRLNRLIEDILNISRIESGLVKVEKKPVSLALVIQEQLQMIKNYAEEKNIKVVCPELIVFDQVYGDKDMLSQVVVNLLSNAIKYTPAGGTVTIAGLARVSITDTGVGIPENKLGHLFEKFYRVEENGKMAKGTGLGLNLVKRIIEKVHNGRVFVQSKEGCGSTFGFELPLATAEVVEGSV